MYSWRLFDCDNMKVIPATNLNETNESNTTTEIHISRYITTPEIIEANAETSESHLYDHIFLTRHSNQSGIIAPESEESPNNSSFNSSIDESNGAEELINSQSLNMETIETTTEATPPETTPSETITSEMTSMTLKLSPDYDEDDIYLETLKIIAILLFVCITITAILVTSFAIIAFSIFRPQNSDKLETDKPHD